VDLHRSVAEPLNRATRPTISRSVTWVIVGFSLCFGTSLKGLIGDPRTYFMFSGVGGATHPALAPTIIVFAMFQLKFAVITPALITGSFAAMSKEGKKKTAKK